VINVADYPGKFDTGRAGWTMAAGGTIAGGQLVAISASGTVSAATTALAGKVVGVSTRDVVSGDKVVVYPLGMVHETTCGTGGVTAGDPLKTDNTGLVTLYVVGTDALTQLIGYALTTASAAAKVRWIGR
jgi:Uncharacterized conserved protein (DUF2190)